MARRGELLKKVNEMLITDEMLGIVAGSSIGEDELKAIRALCV